jgi:hypothetical protein
MTSKNNPSLYDYCKNPQEYTNSDLSETTKKYWSQLCPFLGPDFTPPITNSKQDPEFFFQMVNFFHYGRIIETEKNKETYRENYSQQALDRAGQFFMNLINMIPLMIIASIPFTKVPLLPVLLGPGKVVSVLSSDALKPFMSEFFPEILENFSKEIVQSGGTELIVNSSKIFLSAIGRFFPSFAKTIGLRVGEDLSEELSENTIAFLIRNAASAVADIGVGSIGIVAGIISSELFSYLMVGQMILQLVGMALDFWDPCGLNNEMDDKALQSFCDSINDIFMKSLLSKYCSHQDSYGNVTYTKTFPIVYYADTAIQNYKSDYYQQRLLKHITDYLGSLQYNSDGYPILIPSEKGQLLTNSDIAKITRNVNTVSNWANNNTVAQNWLAKWWPLLLGFTILIIIILIIIIKNRNVAI